MQHTDYNQIAAEYKKAKQHPWRIHVELYTMFQLIGDVHGKSVLDLACGEGFLTREVKRRGASRVVGVDLSEAMVELGRRQEKQDPLGIDYVQSDARDIKLNEKFDLVIAGYLLNYAETRDQLLAMCRAIANHLKPAGRFVTVNNNPKEEHVPDCRPYGFDKLVQGKLKEGTEILYRIYLDEGSIDIINYHLEPSTHEEAFKAVGFREVRWHNPQLAPSEQPNRQVWEQFLQHPPIILMECLHGQ